MTAAGRLDGKPVEGVERSPERLRFPGEGIAFAPDLSFIPTASAGPGSG